MKNDVLIVANVFARKFPLYLARAFSPFRERRPQNVSQALDKTRQIVYVYEVTYSRVLFFHSAIAVYK